MFLQIGTILILGLAHRHSMGSLLQVDRQPSHDHIRAFRENLQVPSVERHHNLVSSTFARFTGLDLELSEKRNRVKGEINAEINSRAADHDFVLGHQPG